MNIADKLIKVGKLLETDEGGYIEPGAFKAFQDLLCGIAEKIEIDCPESSDSTEIYRFRDLSWLEIQNPRQEAFPGNIF